MLVPFTTLKAAQAAAVLLRADPSRRMSRLRLLKLLYIADRELLVERGRPITGDRVVAMDHGPVLSNTYSLIKGDSYGSTEWQRYLPSAGPRDLELAEDPGVGKLTRREIDKLLDVSTRFAAASDWDVARFTHGYPEFQKNRPLDGAGTCNAIPLDDLLEATGMFAHKGELMERYRAEAAAERAFR